MRVLLDTHTLIWWATDESKISKSIMRLFSSPEIEVFMSVVNAWEIQIKHQLGKLKLNEPLSFIIEKQLADGFRMLPIKLDHILRLDALPLHHKDPFDRLLIAQAIEEKLVLLTADKWIQRYDVSVIW